MMRSTTIYDRGDVVSVPFLFSEKPVAKNRPAIVISSREYNESRQGVILAGVTSNLAAPRFVGEQPIRDWQTCGLRAPSGVAGILQTVKRVNIRHRVGSLSATDLDAVSEAMRAALGL